MTNSRKTDDANMRSFSDAYGVLQRHAETLRDQSEPNIDDLLTIVTESVQAYQVCKERIDAVEAALKAALDGAGMAASTPTGAAAPERASDAPGKSAPRTARQAPPPAKAEFGDDDDIPF
ncbi:exodeoxyribonuclease VII small subunit [Polaromonas sp.]|uniref:exodeoxyribonuclease VII small subunit n=1 Tax=Polaromonas sp. TaxID=1869339 RepID=UPI00352A5C3B